MVAAGNPGGPFTPAEFQYQLSATEGSIKYSISGLPDWLTASSTEGTVSTPITVIFTVNTKANGLASGTYGPITITFTNSDTGKGTQTRTATLTVNAPSLQVAPATNIAASGTQGGPFSPDSFSYTLSVASGSVGYSITNVPAWLTLFCIWQRGLPRTEPNLSPTGCGAGLRPSICGAATLARVPWRRFACAASQSRSVAFPEARARHQTQLCMRPTRGSRHSQG